MPIVPTYSAPQVGANLLPQARLTTPDRPDTPDIAGAQTQQMARGMLNAGGDGARLALDVQNTANQLRVDEALNAAKETALKLAFDKDTGYQSLKGKNALERPDGKPLEEEYGDVLKKRIEELGAGLGNDAQRQAFALNSNDILTSFKGGVIQHEAQEFRTYGLSVAEGVQATALREIGLNYNNPAATDSAILRIQAEGYRMGQLLGKSAEWQEAQVRKLTSNGHKVALMAALDNNDVGFADMYLKKYSKHMDADDILAVRGHITKEMNNQVGLAVASDTLGKFQSRIATTDAERAFNIAVGTESNHRQFDNDGKPLTSNKGAIGIAQVMPGTAPEAAKLAGLPWDENRYKTDANYNKALGLAYFQEQLRTTGGDLAKSYAAYNAGPGRLQEAEKKAAQWNKLAANDPAMAPRTWLDYMPAETKNYVAKNMKAFEAGQGVGARPTLEEIDAELRSDPRIAGNPDRLKVAREEAGRRYEQQTKAIKQRDEEAVAEAMRGVIENGGRWSDLPLAVRSRVPAKEVDSVISFAQKISKGDDTTSLWLYNDLTAHPEKLTSYSEAEFFALRRELSEADFKHFSNERNKRMGGASGSNGPGDLNSQAIKTVLEDRLRTLGIDPTPKSDGGSDDRRVGGIRKFVNDYFVTAQREAGKKFSDAEVTQHIDALFAKNATFRGWFSDSSGPMLAMKAGQIDSATRQKIKDAYKRQGIDDPTDAQVLNAFWNLKVSRK